MSASMLALLDYCDAVKKSLILDPAHPRRKVLGVDIDIREHNRVAIEAHPMASRINMIQGSSIDPDVIAEVYRRAIGNPTILICLDSNHTHDHVFSELQAYAPGISCAPPLKQSHGRFPSSRGYGFLPSQICKDCYRLC